MAIVNTELCDLNNVVLTDTGDITHCDEKSRKRPKRILHFSDGDLEEYSEDETDTPKEIKAVAQIDFKTLNWLPWAWYMTSWASCKILDGCDYIGESLASFFGITSPKYQFEINEYYRQKAYEEEMNTKQQAEMAGWTTSVQNNIIQSDNQPSSNTNCNI